MSLAARKAVGKLNPANTYFLLCDIQERFRDVIYHFPQVRRFAWGGAAGGLGLPRPPQSIRSDELRSWWQSLDAVLDPPNSLPPLTHT